MRAASIEGARRGKRVRTTKADPAASRHPDLVKRDVRRQRIQSALGDRPDVRADLGRRGLRLLHRRRVLPDDRGLAGRVAHAHHDGPRRDRDGPLVTRHTLHGLRCHCDAGSQFTSIRYGERLAEIGAVPSIGTIGDSYDNALAETVNGYYKAELIRGPARTRPWKTVEDVELATLGWVHWHNHQPPARLPRRRPAGRVRSQRSTLRNGTTNPWSKSNSPSDVSRGSQGVSGCHHGAG